MNATSSSRKAPPSDLGDLLRYWRDLRGVSQLDLSFEAGISQRQISFIESGRSVPGRDTLLTLAQTLDVPLRERNALLLAAGYAPVYSDAPWNAAEMDGVTRALERVVRQHEPFPAIVMDRHWNVLMTNPAAPRFFNCFIDMAARTGPRNMLHLMFDPDGMRPFLADWESVASSLLQRVYRESVGHMIDTGTRRLLDELLAYPDVPAGWKTHHERAPAEALPMVPLGFIRDGMVLRYFSMVTTVGAPRNVAAQELRLECLFPVDDETEARHRALLAGAARQVQAVKP
ncbi:helix-turn-helix domain-containing protein [Burkholderia plantarii]|uniref:helix-turn-helix domain-containing protein n=1 Tax=Burkholderia plantarii TaxID=41899 RepID=UPI0006D89049|nr:helix-turn-helix transcriptional regulator [Burkholderia plantarii]ALK33049.1 transcriptional regulator, XRE family [Burkholderia plantarii]GLZ20482.1 transcriptional regulator [Burkholderia plantarii]